MLDLLDLSLAPSTRTSEGVLGDFQSEELDRIAIVFVSCPRARVEVSSGDVPLLHSSAKWVEQRLGWFELDERIGMEKVADEALPSIPGRRQGSSKYPGTMSCRVGRWMNLVGVELACIGWRRVADIRDLRRVAVDWIEDASNILVME